MENRSDLPVGVHRSRTAGKDDEPQSRRRRRNKPVNHKSRKYILDLGDDDNDDASGNQAKLPKTEQTPPGYRRASSHPAKQATKKKGLSFSESSSSASIPLSNQGNGSAPPQELSKSLSSSDEGMRTPDGSADDESDLEVPYSQDLGDQPRRRRRPSNSDSDKEDGNTRRKAKEPLRPGDVIAYFSPAFVYGDPRAYRVAQVIRTQAGARDGCLDLDNAEYLEADTWIKRVGEYDKRSGKLYKHPGVQREIRDFRIQTAKLPGVSSGLALQVQRLAHAIEETRAQIETIPQRMAEEQANKEESVSSTDEEVSIVDMVSARRAAARISVAPSRSTLQRNEEESSDDSLFLQGSKKHSSANLQDTQSIGSFSSDQENCGKLHRSQKGPPLSQRQSNRASTKSATVEPRHTFRLSRASTSSMLSPVSSGRKGLSATTLESKTRSPSPPKLVANKQTPATASSEKSAAAAAKAMYDMGFMSDSSEEEELLKPFFGSSSKPRKASATTRKSTPMDSMLLPSKEEVTTGREATSSYKPPRQSFEVKGLAQRRARGLSEKSKTLQEAEAEALDSSNDDELSRAAASRDRMKRRKTDRQSKPSRKEAEKKKSLQLRKSTEMDSVFRPNELEQKGPVEYGFVDSDQEQTKRAPRRSAFQDPLARMVDCDSIESFQQSQSPAKRRSAGHWFQNSSKSSKRRSSQSGPMSLELEPVDHRDA